MAYLEANYLEAFQMVLVLLDSKPCMPKSYSNRGGKIDIPTTFR